MLTAEEIQGIGVALNEATLLGIAITAEKRAAEITFAVLTLPSDGSPSPLDRRIQVLPRSVGRVAASLRNGPWNDDTADVLPLQLDDILALRARMQQEIYGWEFVDADEDGFKRWSDKLSLDCEFGSDGRTHSITPSSKTMFRMSATWTSGSGSTRLAFGHRHR